MLKYNLKAAVNSIKFLLRLLPTRKENYLLMLSSTFKIICLSFPSFLHHTNGIRLITDRFVVRILIDEFPTYMYN